MRKIILLFTLIVFSIMSFGQSATATATANVVTPLTISKNVDMDFGTVSVSPTLAGTVILAPASTRTVTGGSQFISSSTATAASFTVTGLAASTYTITLPTSITVSKTGPAVSMTVNSFTSTPLNSGTLTGGTQTLNVGATLNMTAAQATGVYVSTAFTVTVNYN